MHTTLSHVIDQLDQPDTVSARPGNFGTPWRFHRAVRQANSYRHGIPFDF